MTPDHTDTNLSTPNLSGAKVQKFGGSSLATPEKIGKVADRIAADRRAGHDVVVVASAMGGRTDALVQLADAVTDSSPPARELDALLSTGESVSTALLAMALEDRGVPAASMRGWQAGIRTEGPHGHARIAGVETSALRAELEAGRVPVVCGFQGIDADGAIQTLGRGGSDTSAVAIAHALGATCEIYSDVPGVFSADPRDVPNAALVDHVRYDEMLAYAQQGAKVLNEDAVAYAQQMDVTIHARATFLHEEGTRVNAEAPLSVVTGVASRKLAYRIAGNAGVVEGLAKEHHLVARRAEDGPHEAAVVLHEGATAEDLLGVTVSGPIATVSLVGHRVGELETLGKGELEKAGIPVEAVFLSDCALTFVIPHGEPKRASRVLHAGFIEGALGAALDARLGGRSGSKRLHA
ncbi:MAG TPA: aspartate kinase [Polyangiaceae bacterium LLY-WYZ-15_(1-7)]|nr:aspartate kinase [Polyangiaceae bacterium LLY-WYZ-15_(1-7)]HJL01739.1 aspartate kinase [Polyangiaceae bacterium LLY-WYZ-15_(1-7)]HJL08001.1 aspartate kinase [Polyangiaceae bacterium LLY-WYZ-15_(1-7)]HJL26404.1 aspartate kinase [Polyangiaceae bacterium LLY-WYZ-15_(1-7)]HJL28026.1 aspartate kinase [Polyangiaceae bacterium LLY-WYZ-15_(1-7)]